MINEMINEIRNHLNYNFNIIKLVGNKADLSHLHDVTTEDAKAFAEKENIYFMETSALESTKVVNVFTELVTKICHNMIVRSKGQMINIFSKDDVLALMKKAGCCLT
ncbi:putative small GTPase, P-loop containing nucleoside triphosphate hydrolase [Helianthus anomalus]